MNGLRWVLNITQLRDGSVLLTLVTDNETGFSRVKGLRVENRLARLRTRLLVGCGCRSDDGSCG